MPVVVEFAFWGEEFQRSVVQSVRNDFYGSPESILGVGMIHDSNRHVDSAEVADGDDIGWIVGCSGMRFAMFYGRNG